MDAKGILQEAKQKAREGNLEAGISQVRESLKGMPRNLEARLFLGSCLLQAGDAVRAREQFEMVLRSDPRNRSALLGLGEALYQSGDGEGAGQAIGRAVELYPEDEEARRLLRILQAGGQSGQSGVINYPQIIEDSEESNEEDEDQDGEDEEDDGEEFEEEGDEDEEDEVEEQELRALGKDIEAVSTENARPVVALDENFGWPELEQSNFRVVPQPPPGEPLPDEPPPPEASGFPPLEVILTSRSRLIDKYGAEGFAKIAEKLGELRETISATRKIETEIIYVDHPLSLKPYGLVPVDPSDPDAIRGLLGRLEKVLAKEGNNAHFILILGGEGIIPFFSLPNPTEDRDEVVLSDAPYAGGENYFQPRRAVGRIPDGVSPDLSFLLNLLDSAIAAHKASKNGWLRRIMPKRSFRGLGLTAQIWKEAAALVYSPLGKVKAMEVSPPASDLEFLEKHQEVPALAYFNLHGVEDSPYWFGHEVQDGEEEFPIALTPQNLAWAQAASSVVFSEACYGAKFVERKVGDSLSLSFLAAGARGFIGSTAMSYGALQPPLTGADLLGLNLWRGLRQGYPIGEALRRAKLGTVEEMETRQGFLDGEDQKTILSFILLGDPSLPAPVLSAAWKINGMEKKAGSCPAVVCGRKMKEQAIIALSPKVMAKVKGELASRIKGIATEAIQVRAAAFCHGECGCTGAHTAGQNFERSHQPTQRLFFSVHKVKPLVGQRSLPQILRVTTDAEGNVLKVAFSK